MLKKLARIPVLYDIYGPLLTSRQSRCLEMYYHEDFSLGEIAESLDITRQAVYDQLRRAEAALEGYESRLHVAARQKETRVILQELAALLEKAEAGAFGGAAESVQEDAAPAAAPSQLSRSGSDEGLARSGSDEGLARSESEEGLARSGSDEGLARSGSDEGLARSGSDEGLARSGSDEGLARSGSDEGLESGETLKRARHIVNRLLKTWESSFTGDDHTEPGGSGRRQYRERGPSFVSKFD